MQGQQRQQGTAPGKGNGTGGRGNGQPGQRTLTMSLPPRRGGSSSSSSSDDEATSLGGDRDEASRGERDRAQRDLLDRAISPHLPVGDSDDDEFYSMESSSDEELEPPDEQALFDDDEEWAEVHQVEAETEQRATTATPDSVHDHWLGRQWNRLPRVASRAYNWWYGSQPEGDESMVTQLAREVLINKLKDKLNVSAATINGFKIDGGLITAESIECGPLARTIAGNDILCGGFVLAGFELQLSLGDIVNLVRTQRLGDAVTLRFSSLSIPLLQVLTGGGTAPTQPSQAQASTSSSQVQPPPESTLPETVRSLLAALRLGLHLGAIDVQLHHRDAHGLICGVRIEQGAVRLQPDSGAVKLAKDAILGPRGGTPVTLAGKSYTCETLRAHVLDLLQRARTSSYAFIYTKQLDTLAEELRAALAGDGFTADERAEYQAVIDYLGGQTGALAAHDERITQRDAELARAQRVETARRIEELGDDYDTGGAAGRIRLSDVHAGVVGSQFASDQHTRAEVHVGGVRVDGLDTEVAGFQTRIANAEVGPLDVRLNDDQVGVRLGGAKVKGAEAWNQDGTGGFVEKLKVGETRASARTGDVLQPGRAVEGAVHLGGVTVKNAGGTSGELATLVERVDVGASDVAVHKRGDDQRVDATGLEVDVGKVSGALDARTAFSANHLHLAPSTVHGARTPSDASDDGVRTDATVQIGALDAEKLSVSQPRANVGGGADRLHLGSIGATVVDDPAAKHRAGAFQLGAINAHGVRGASGAMGGSVEHAFVGPTRVGVDQHGDDARVDATGLAINLGGLGGTLDADTTVGADSLRLEPSAVHGERKGGAIGGSVSTGALEVDDLVADRKKTDEHVELANLHVGGVTASKHGDQTGAGVTGLGLTRLRGHSGERSASLGSLTLDTLTAGGDLEARDGQLHAGTLTAGPLDLRRGDAFGAPTAHADQLVVAPTDAHVGPTGATFANQGVHVHGVDLSSGGGTVHAARVDTGLLEGGYGPRVDQPTHPAFDVHLADAGVTGLDAGQLSLTDDTPTATELHLASAELHGLHGRGRDDGGLEAQLDGASLTALEMKRQRQDLDAQPATPQDWHLHQDRLRLGHLGIGRVGLGRPEGDDVPDGRRDLAIERVEVLDADVTTRDASDRHDHLERKAKLNVDAVSANVEAERKIAQRKREEIERARQLPPEPEKKPSSVLGKVEHKVTGGVKKLFGLKKKDPGEKELEQADKQVKKAEKQLARAREEAERVERKQQQAAEKEVRKEKHAKTKDRGNHHHIGALTLDSFEAELSGFDDDAPTVDAAHLGTVEGAHLAESRLRDQLDNLTVDIHEMKLDVDEAGNGTITVRAITGKKMLENLAGNKLGGLADKITGLDGNELNLVIAVEDGVIQLGRLQLGTAHNWLRTQLVKRLAKLHVGGDKASKSLRGNHTRPHLHIPLVGDQQLEHLGLAGLHQEDKKVLVSRNIEARGGGLHLGNLLENGLQTAVDSALGNEPQVHGLSNASVSGVSVDGVRASRDDGARPGDKPVEDVRAAVGKAAVGASTLELDSVEMVRNLMASLAGMFGGTPPTTQEPTPKPEPTSDRTPSSEPSPGMLDGMFAMLEKLGGQPSQPSSRTTSKPSGSSSAGKPRLSHLLGNPQGTEQLTSFLTGGGGDCGIHAMFGAPTGIGGIVRAANPNVQRKQLADRLDGSDGQHQAHVDKVAFTQLIAELVLQILTHQGDLGLEIKHFGQIAGFFDAMLLAKQLDDIDYAAHASDSTEYAMDLLRHFVLDPDDDIGFLLRDQLIQDVMISNTESERALRRRLEQAGGDQERHVIIMKADPAHLCKLLISNIDVMVGLAASCDAPGWVTRRQHALQQTHAQLGGNLRQAVHGYIDVLLPAYARVVRTAGYYLHDLDLQLLALINDLDLHIYNESDLVGGTFVEQLHQPGTSGSVDVFHSHAHYERARRQ